MLKIAVKSALLAGAAWGVLGAPALAQAVPQDQATTVEEIVVTARRTEESLQRTPLSISAFRGETLERAGTQQVTDLQGQVPNLNIVQGRGSSNATNIYIRGVGQPDALQTFDPAVGVYVDDVYYSRIRGTQFDLLDLERVEVLRGPQGTLYGKNTIGGALKLVSRRPGDEFRARGSIAYGDYNLIDVQGAVSGPITDGLAFGLSALRSTRDGYVTDPITGREYNDKDTVAVRAALAWDPATNLRIDLTADYSRDDAGLVVGQATNSLVGSSGQVIVAIPSPLPEYNFETSVDPDLPNETRLESRGLALNAAWDVSDSLTLRSITAFRKLNTDDYIDFDATPSEVTSALVAVDQEQFSQELQATYVSGPITAVGGLYYLKEDVSSHQEAYADDLLGPLFLNSGFLRTIDDALETTSRAAYGNVTFQATEALRLSAGVRYTEEEKDYVRTTSTFFSALPAFNATFPFAPPTGEYDDTSIMASADYQLTPDLMVYARYAQGFKSGGFNGRANSASEATAYEPETADSWEFGLKGSTQDRRLRFNLALFTTDYQDFQARVSGVENDPVTNLPVAVLSVINAGELEIWGAEFDAVWAVTDSFTFDLQLGHLDAEYGEFNDARFTATGGSRAFQEPAFSPSWTARYGAQYVVELANGSDLTFGGSMRFRSRMALAVDNTAVNSTVQLPGMFQDDYYLYDARVVWDDPTDRYTVGLYGQNLTDEVYRTDAQEFSSVGGIRTAYYGAPRTWMVKFTARY
ncbi:TonB-dependent receptor [Brevundimonas balnearis]|uniref:TonB-dependent receptor n=1 Tax=Brevundimonas balnearis TaxID=1572858 RepID=A0ABV6R4A9_9CAUL